MPRQPFGGLLEPSRTANKALAAMIQQAYVQGSYTRSVVDHEEALGMSGMFKSQVGRM